MGLFGKSPKVPDTVDDESWFNLRWAASKQQDKDGGMFSRKAVDRRKATSDQKRKSIWS
jgi:hypothetical protein